MIEKYLYIKQFATTLTLDEQGDLGIMPKTA